jgi:hypothetical protein
LLDPLARLNLVRLGLDLRVQGSGWHAGIEPCLRNLRRPDER